MADAIVVAKVAGYSLKVAGLIKSAATHRWHGDKRLAEAVASDFLSVVPDFARPVARLEAEGNVLSRATTVGCADSRPKSEDHASE
jgi:hypothetical protein